MFTVFFIQDSALAQSTGNGPVYDTGAGEEITIDGTKEGSDSSDSSLLQFLINSNGHTEGPLDPNLVNTFGPGDDNPGGDDPENEHETDGECAEEKEKIRDALSDYLDCKPELKKPNSGEDWKDKWIDPYINEIGTSDFPINSEIEFMERNIEINEGLCAEEPLSNQLEALKDLRDCLSESISKVRNKAVS